MPLQQLPNETSQPDAHQRRRSDLRNLKPHELLLRLVQLMVLHGLPTGALSDLVVLVAQLLNHEVKLCRRLT